MWGKCHDVAQLSLIIKFVDTIVLVSDLFVVLQDRAGEKGGTFYQHG